MKIRFFIVFVVFVSSLSFSQEDKRLALVIGNANYDKGELKNPVNDARLVASTLDSLNFDVILKENLSTKREMLSAVKEFGVKRPEYDVAFVYYAGHGIQVEDENFLLPTKEVFEEEFDVMDYGVSVQNIMRYLRTQTNEVNILILDACRDNPFESSWSATRSLKGGGLAKIPPPTGSLIAFSTDSGQTAPDGDGQNSVYTTSLTKNMLLEDTSIDQVFRNVRAEVLAKTGGGQRPVEATQLTGQAFYLKPGTFEGDFLKIDEYLINRSIENNNNWANDVIEITTAILAKDPTNSKAYSKRGDAYCLVENYSEATKNYKLSIKHDPKSILPYLSYYQNSNSVAYAGLLEVYGSGYVKAPVEEVLMFINKYRSLGENNPYLYRFLTYEVGQKLFVKKNFVREEELKKIEWEWHYKDEFENMIKFWESISDEDILFYAGKIYFNNTKKNSVYDVEATLLDRKNQLNFNLMTKSKTKNIYDKYFNLIVDGSNAFKKKNENILKSGGGMFNVNFWIKYAYETKRDWKAVISLLEENLAFDKSAASIIGSTRELINYYNLSSEFNKSFKAVDRILDLVNSKELSVFNYKYFVGDVYMAAILNNYVIKNDYVESLNLIEDVFNKIEDGVLGGESLFVKVEGKYIINPAAKENSLFDSEYVSLFQYLKYLINLALERKEVSEDDYLKAVSLLDFFDVDYEEYVIMVKNNDTKLIGNINFSQFNNLYYFYNHQGEQFDDLIKTIGSELDVSRLKLNVVLDVFTNSIPSWPNYIVNK